MLDEIANNMVVQYGALGLMTMLLILGNVAQWFDRRDKDRERKQTTDLLIERMAEQTAAMVELNVLLRERQR